MLYISKEQSTIIKGVAISMMLFLHLFNGQHTDLCTNLFYVGDVPLALWLTRACNPVSFFLLLSGYGLACKYEGESLSPRYQFRRILILYLHYWVVLAIFLVIGHLLHPSQYPGSLSTLIANVSGWNTDYCSEMWFLLPYSLVSLLSLYIIRVINRIGLGWALLGTACLQVLTSFMISRFGVFFYTHMLAYQPLLFIHMLYTFTLGVVLRRTSLHLNFKKTSPLCQAVIVLCIFALVILQCVIGFGLGYMYNTPLIVILLCQLNFPSWLKNILLELGRKSMPIWMIHCWLAYYLFTPQVYSLKYPVLIFIGLAVASYLLSILIMWIVGVIRRAIVVVTQENKDL